MVHLFAMILEFSEQFEHGAVIIGAKDRVKMNNL
jgi:hypothetical protein